ncbi:glycosyltransferase family 4 protein [Salinisphaera sp.]|uniref:glycosyltransferase family 4 protein n=1 Tax=Salinisphaera sp. TaxID=1914330 RepID=UPI002D7A1AF0|nr:glycosyltransferase family 4 protein [Salinisphaera sp.]HET7313111.1 glycosyltransferase family 4 protein [Salinisphaera sp.]
MAADPRVLTHVNLARGFRGGERQTELLIRELAGHGMPQRFIGRRDQPLAARLADVPKLEIRAIGKPFIAHVGKARGGLLHAHDGHGAHFAHAANRLVGAPYVITRRVDNRPGGSRTTRAMYRRAAGVAVLSEAIGRVMTAYLPGLEVIRIPSAAGALAVDREAAASLRASWGGTCIVGQVGALDDSQKGQYDTLAAAARLGESDDGWRFVLVGGGRDETALRAAAAAADTLAPQVFFTGHVDNVGDHLAAFDIFVFPSRHEGLGSTLLDAMQAGLPIVASDVDGIPEIIEHEVNGLLVPPGDAYALAFAVQRLRDDPALAQRLAAAARARVAGYTAAAMAGRYRRWYAEIGADVAGLSQEDRLR